jgi:hypothetical protein
MLGSDHNRFDAGSRLRKSLSNDAVRAADERGVNCQDHRQTLEGLQLAQISVG